MNLARLFPLGHRMRYSVLMIVSKSVDFVTDMISLPGLEEKDAWTIKV